MLFNSLLFFPFLVATLILYYIITPRYKWSVIAVANFFYYSSFEPYYCLILLCQILIAFYGAIYLSKLSEEKKRRNFYIFLVLSTLSPLLFFKYTGFFLNILTLNFSSPTLAFLLPLGISFYTFQLLAFITEVYWEQSKPIDHFGRFVAAYSFFPLLLSGPIERPTRLLTIFDSTVKFKLADISSGLKLFLIGLFYKVVLADRLAIYSNMIYNNSEVHTGGSFILATFFFTLQIYGDFAGYSFMALGICRMFGIDVINNFNFPYFSRSISEFWNRWHISLSSWLRDYIFTPLSYSGFLKGRLSSFNVYITVIITFLASGLWHGANWNFVFWGFLNGVFIACGIATQKFRKSIRLRFPNRIAKLFFSLNSWILTFLLLNLLWVFFRVNSVGTGFEVLHKMISSPFSLNIGDRSQIFLSLCSILMLFCYEVTRFFNLIKSRSMAFRVIGYTLLLFIIILFGVFDGSQFIYFKF